MGDKEMSWVASLPFVKMMVQGLMTKPIEICDKSSPGYEKLRGQRTRCFSIDKEKVAERKRLYAEADSRSKTGKLLTKVEDVSFISTNDVVSSAFFNATGARLPLFTMNLCRLCPEFAEDMAGNYETSLILDPPSYESPALIRRALLGRPYRRARPMPLPGFCGKTSAAFITTCGACTPPATPPSPSITLCPVAPARQPVGVL